MDGEGQSCEGERGSWRTTQSQNRVEQLTGLLPIGLGPEKDSVLTLGSKVSSWKEESQHGHHWWGGPRRWYEKVLGAPDPQLACPLPPPHCGTLSAPSGPAALTTGLSLPPPVARRGVTGTHP